MVLALVLAGVGCERIGEAPSDPELREALGIADGVLIHQIVLSGRGDRTRVFPAHVQVEVGDLVQFRVMDRRVHRIHFPMDRLGPAAQEFLRSTGQFSPAPLVELDARLVITFEGAPPGEYPFVVEGFGDPVEGSVTVRGS